MTDTQRNKRPARRPDCVTETRIGNTILVVSGFFKEGAFFWLWKKYSGRLHQWPESFFQSRRVQRYADSRWRRCTAQQYF